MNFIRNYFLKKKYNYLLVGTFSSYVILTLLLFVLPNDYLINSSGTGANNNLFLFILGSIILAPLVEEIVFRGYFTNNRIFKIISIISLPLYVALSKNYYVLFFVIPYTIMLVFDFYKKNKINKHVIILTNIIIFAIYHYELIDFAQLGTIFPILSQIGGGFFLLWLIINYNIKTSIFFHFLKNISLILPLIFIIQFPDMNIKTLETEQFKITWQKVPSFKVNSNLTFLNRHELEAKNFTPLSLINNKITKDNYIEIIPFQKYNISIKIIDNNKTINDEELIKILLESELILKFDKNLSQKTVVL